jgi:hypothetical protein
MTEHGDLERMRSDAASGAGDPLVGGLNAILEVERAGTRILTALMATAGVPGANALLAQVQRDQACNCAQLTRIVRRLGGAPSMAVGSLRDKVLALDRLEDRLELMNRGQAWIARRLDHIVPRVADAGIRAELGEIRDTHRANIAVCAVLLDGLSEFAIEDEYAIDD